MSSAPELSRLQRHTSEQSRHPIAWALACRSIRARRSPAGCGWVVEIGTDVPAPPATPCVDDDEAASALSPRRTASEGAGGFSEGLGRTGTLNKTLNNLRVSNASSTKPVC